MDKVATPTSKPCSQCGEDKPLTDFIKQRRGKYGRQAACKPCQNKQRKQRLAGTACKVEGCNNQARTQGLCSTHYRQQRLAGAVCKFEGCDKAQATKGLCQTHYQQQRLAGTVCEVEGCDTAQYCRGLCYTHYEQRRFAGTVCEVEGCDTAQYCRGLCRTHYEQQRLAGTVCEVEGCDSTQFVSRLCQTHYNQQRLAGTVCEVEGCDNQQVSKAAGLCQAHYLRLLKYGDPLGKGRQWDPETRPTYVYCYVHDIEGLVKVGHGNDERVATWRRQGWTLLDSVILPRKEARELEEGTHQIWWDMGMKSEHDLGSRRDGAREMTEATTEAVQVALQRIGEAHKEILAAA